ncbi:MAG: hypothetical protein AAFQ50_10490, partial [Pseudomonadota bacterium]
DRFVETLADRLTALFKSEDPDVDTVLHLTLSAALRACYRSKDFREGMQWDIDLSTLQAIARVEALLGDAIAELRSAHKITDIALIQMAKRISRDATDRESALATLGQMVDAYERLAEQGTRPSNHPNFIDNVFAEVARLNAEDRTDDAAQAFEDALTREAEEAATRPQILLRGLADQHILRGDAAGLAQTQERLFRRDGLTGADLYRALRNWGIERHREGERSGSPFDLHVAVATAKRCAPLAPDDEWRAGSLNDLGIALRTLGERGDTDTLHRAIAAYEAALEVNAREDMPPQWAMTQMNLGNAFAILWERGDAGALPRAITAYEPALEVRTRKDMPTQWAMTQMNLGNALATLGQRGDADALRRAIAAYEAALEVNTRKEMPAQWAMTQMNLGNALRVLGARGDAGALHRAITAYEAALEVNTRKDMPSDWAMTRSNMAGAFRALAEAEGDRAADHIATGLAAIEDALEIFTQDTAPAYFETFDRIRTSLLALRDGL